MRIRRITNEMSNASKTKWESLMHPSECSEQLRVLLA